jgi:hypothetical protein
MSLASLKTDFSARLLRGGNQLAECREDNLKLLVVLMFERTDFAVFGKAPYVSPNRLIQDFRRHLVELREIGIKHDLLTANQIDSALDDFDGHN